MRRWSRARGRPRRMWRLATSWRARRRAFRSTRPSVRGPRGPCRLCPCPRPSPLDSGWWRRSTPARDPPIPRHTSKLKKRQKRSCRGQLPVQKNTRPGGRKTPTRGGGLFSFTMYFLIFFYWLVIYFSIFLLCFVLFGYFFLSMNFYSYANILFYWRGKFWMPICQNDFNLLLLIKGKKSFRIRILTVRYGTLQNLVTR